MRHHLEALSARPDDVARLLAQLEEQGQVTVIGHVLTEGDFLISRAPKDERLIATEKGVTILLDTKLTEALIGEGLAREVINRVQRLRKDSGLQVSDRIVLEVAADTKLIGAVEAHRDYISRETLATKLVIQVGLAGLEAAFEVDGQPIHLAVKLAAPS